MLQPPDGLSRRQLLRLGFFAAAALAARELAATLAPFIRVTRLGFECSSFARSRS